MLQRMRVFLVEWRARFREAGPAGRLVMIIMGVILFCLLCSVASLAY
jgi:hypothetical protein